MINIRSTLNCTPTTFTWPCRTILTGMMSTFKGSASSSKNLLTKNVNMLRCSLSFKTRGGRIKLSDIKAPAAGEWDSGLDAMQDALALEKKVNQALLDLHVCASSHNDAQLTDFIEGHFLTNQVE